MNVEPVTRVLIQDSTMKIAPAPSPAVPLMKVELITLQLTAPPLNRRLPPLVPEELPMKVELVIVPLAPYHETLPPLKLAVLSVNLQCIKRPLVAVQ